MQNINKITKLIAKLVLTLCMALAMLASGFPLAQMGNMLQQAEIGGSTEQIVDRMTIQQAQAAMSGETVFYLKKDPADSNQTYNALSLTPPGPGAETANGTAGTVNVNANPPTALCEAAENNTEAINRVNVGAAAVAHRCAASFISPPVGQTWNIQTSDTGAVYGSITIVDSATGVVAQTNLFVYKWDGSTLTRIATLNSTTDPSTTITNVNFAAQAPAANITVNPSDRIVVIASKNVTTSASSATTSILFDSTARTAAHVTLKYTLVAPNKPDLTNAKDDDFTTDTATAACSTSGTVFNTKWTCLHGSAANSSGEYNVGGTGATPAGDSSGWLWIRNKLTATGAVPSNFGSTPSNTYMYQTLPAEGYGNGSVTTVVNASHAYTVGATNATTPFNHGGLVLWTSNTDYIEMQVYADGAKTGANTVKVALNTNGTLSGATSLNATTTTGTYSRVWLRFVHTGGSYQGQYSTDGTTFTNVGSAVSHSAFSRVGLNVFNIINNPISMYSAAFEYFDYGFPAPSVTISGVYKAYDQTTNGANGVTIGVAVGATLQTGLTGNTTSSGAFSFSINKPATGAVITVWASGVADADEAVAVTKYDGSGNITGILLYKEHLTIGSDDNQTLTGTNIASYDYSAAGNNEDILFDQNTTSTVLTLDNLGNSTQERLYIKSGNTLDGEDQGSGFTITTINSAKIDVRGALGIAYDGTITLNGSGTDTTCGSVNQMPLCVSGSFTVPYNINYNGTSATAIAALNYSVGLNLGTTADSNAVTYSLTGNTSVTNASSFLTIGNASSSNTDTLALSSYTLTLGGGFTITSRGALDAGTGTVKYTGVGAPTITAATYYNLEVLPGANNITHTFAAGTTTVSNNFIAGNGTNTGVVVTAATNNTTLNVGGNFTIAANTTFTAHASNALTVGGNFTRTGTFTHSNGTVVFDNNSKTTIIAGGDTNFYNLTVATAGKNIQFTAGQTFKISGLLSVTGSSGNNVVFTSTSTSQWTIDHQGTESITYLTVSYGACFSGSPASTTITLGTGSTNGGNNGTCWEFPAAPITISGVYKAYDQTTNGANGVTILVAVGATLQTGLTGNTTSSGAFSFSINQPSSGAVITVWADNVADADEAVAVTKYDGSGNITGILLYKEHLTLGSDDNQTLTSSEIGTYDNSVSGDEDIFMDTKSSATCDGIASFTGLCVDGIGTAGQSTQERLYIKANNTFTPGGNVQTARLQGAGAINGSMGQSLTLTGSGTSSTCGSTAQMPLCLGGSILGMPGFVDYIGSDSLIGPYGYHNLGVGTAADSETGRTYTLAGNASVSGILTIGHASSTNTDTLAASSYTLTLNSYEGSESLIITAKGAFSAQTSTVEYYSSGGTRNVTATTYHNLVLSWDTSGSNPDYILGTGTGQTITVLNDLIMGDSYINADTNDPTIIVGRDFIVDTNAGFTASDSAMLTIGRNFAVNAATGGAFNHGGGSVTLNSAATSVVSGDNTHFFNFTVATAGKNIQFTAGQTFKFSGLLSVTGSSGNNVVFTSTTTSQWTIDHQGDESITYLTVSYGACNSGFPASNAITAGTGSVDGGNNGTCWEFPVVGGITISGTLYSDEGSTAITSGKTVAVRVNGAGVYSGTTNGSGAFSIASVVLSTAGDVITVYVDNDASVDAVVVTKAADTSTNISGFNLYQNRVIVRHENAGPITSADLDQYDSGNDADIPFTVTSGNLVLADNTKLIVWTGKTFAPGGTVTTSPSSSAASTDGDIAIQANAILDMASHALSVGGDFINAGTFTESAAPHTTTFTATATGHSIDLGTGNFENVNFNGAGGGWSFSDASNTITGDLTMTAGTLSGTANITVSGGDVTGNGMINLTGGTFLLDGTGNFGGSVDWTFNNLTFGDGTGTATTSGYGSGGVTISSSLTIAANQTLDASSKTWALSGNGTPFVVTGTFNPATSTVVYAPSATSGVTVTSGTYYNLTFNRASNTFSLTTGGIITNNNLTITAGILDVTASNYPISVGGNWTNGGTFSPGSGTVTFTATDASNVIDNGSSQFNNVIFNGTGGFWSPSTNTMTVAGDLTLTAGTLNNSVGNASIVVNGGDVTGNGTITLTSGTFTLDGTGNFGGNTAWTFNNLSFGDGAGAATSTATGSGSITVSSVLTIAANQTLNAASKIWTLSGSGTPFVATGTFTASSSHVKYTATAATNITTATYATLSLAPTSGSPAYALGSGTTTASSLILGDGTNAVTVTTTANNPSVTVNGNMAINANAVLSGSGSGTITVTGSLNGQGIVNLTGGTVVLPNGGTLGSTENDWTMNNLTLGDGSTAGETDPALNTGFIIKGVLTIRANHILDAADSVWTLQGNGVPLVVSGTLTSGTSTIEFASAGTTGTTVPALTYYNLKVNKAANTFTGASGSLTVNNNLDITTGTLDLNTNDPTLVVAGNLTIAGTLDASASSSLTFRKDWINNGTFNHNSGTVVVSPTGLTIPEIKGSTNSTFHNFTANLPGGVIRFKGGADESSAKTSFLGTLILSGSVAGNLSVESTSSFVLNWYPYFGPSSTLNLSYLVIRDAICATDSRSVVFTDTVLNGGNNGACWSFIFRGGGGGNSIEGGSGGGSGQTGGGAGGGSGGQSGGGSGQTGGGAGGGSGGETP
jgi:hypothetical protein